MNIRFNDIPGFSKLFLDYIKGNEFLHTLIDNKITDRPSNGFDIHPRLKDAIQNSNNSISLTDKQSENIEKLLAGRAGVAVTGQQVGFLYGPIYTILKAATVLMIADKKDNRVPVFWIEDNDHDNLEASQVSVFDNDFNHHEYFCQKTSKDDLLSVAERTFDDDITGTINQIAGQLERFQNARELINLLKSVYIPGVSWADAFLAMMQEAFGENGMIFIKASEVRKNGLFVDVISKMLSEPGRTHDIINNSNNLLIDNGYHIQARSNFFDFFYHDENKRYRIDKIRDGYKIGNKNYSLDDIKELFGQSPIDFSPRVLLRPVCQDKILPTVAFVGGPSEVAYFTQLSGLYKYFGLNLPAVLPRFSATFVTPYARRFVNQYGFNYEELFSSYQDLENHVVSEKFNRDYDNIFEHASDDISMIYKNIEERITELDASLIGAAKHSLNNSMKMLDRLRKKTLTVYKRRNREYFDKMQYANRLVYPGGHLQERIISPVSFMAISGLKPFIEMILDNIEIDNANHRIIEII